MAPVVEKLIEGIKLGEGPHWDVETQSLYFVDIYGKAVHRYIPATKKHIVAPITEKIMRAVDLDPKYNRICGYVSFIIPIKGNKGKFVVGINRVLSAIAWDGESEEITWARKLHEVQKEPEFYDNRFNHAKCDPSGKLWTGTMGAEPAIGFVKPNKGALFSLDPETKQLKTHLTKVWRSNGFTWNIELDQFYYIDSSKGTVDQYDFDIETETITNCTPIFTLKKHDIEGLPGGMTIDTQGYLWVAIYEGFRVIKIDPREPETLLESISLPALEVTSLAFGGPNLDELYVTTSALNLFERDFPSPDDGVLYRITGTGSKGFPPNEATIDLSEPRKQTIKEFLRRKQLYINYPK